MSAKAIISTLPYRLNDEIKREMYQNYLARNLRNISENTAKLVVIASNGKLEAQYMPVEFDEILEKKKTKKEFKKGEVAERIKKKLR